MGSPRAILCSAYFKTVRVASFMSIPRAVARGERVGLFFQVFISLVFSLFSVIFLLLFLRYSLCFIFLSLKRRRILKEKTNR